MLNCYSDKRSGNLESASGTEPTSNYVRCWVAMGWKADIIGSF